MKSFTFTLAALVFCLLAGSAFSAEKLKILIVDGQNNHGWTQTTPVLKQILENSGIFSVDVSTSPPSAPRGPNAPKNPTPEQKAAFEEQVKKFQEQAPAAKAQLAAQWEKWRPKFSDYAAVLSNYNGDLWPDEVCKSFVSYVKDGGGFVCVHAANNSFPQWPEYNEMIGIGGWGGRNEKSGPYLRLRDGKFVKDEITKGGGGGHGSQHEFLIEVHDSEHPITKGLPTKWMHAKDELYHQLRGPADNLTVLASAMSEKTQGGSGEHEPMMLVINYGKGRVFHTPMGHSVDSLKGYGFQVVLPRGTEWAATGKVTLAPPKAEDLPADKAAIRDPAAK